MNDVQEEARFRLEAASVLERLLEQVDDIDVDDIDPAFSQDNLTVTFPDGSVFVLSLQTPVREIWLAANLRAWHFRRGGDGRWVERDTGEDMLGVLGRLFTEKLGVPVRFDP